MKIGPFLLNNTIVKNIWQNRYDQFSLYTYDLFMKF